MEKSVLVPVLQAAMGLVNIQMDHATVVTKVQKAVVIKVDIHDFLLKDILL